MLLYATKDFLKVASHFHGDLSDRISFFSIRRINKAQLTGFIWNILLLLRYFIYDYNIQLKFALIYE